MNSNNTNSTESDDLLARLIHAKERIEVLTCENVELKEMIIEASNEQPMIDDKGHINIQQYLGHRIKEITTENNNYIQELRDVQRSISDLEADTRDLMRQRTERHALICTLREQIATQQMQK